MEIAVTAPSRTAPPRRSLARAEEALDLLAEAGRADDAQFPLFDAAVACALHDDDARSTDQAYAVMEEAISRLRWRLESQATDDALAGALAADLRLGGEVLNPEAADNADVISVCARRRGMPAALCVLYLAAARPCGLALTGSDFPGHFLLRLETDEGPIALDPFGGARVIMPSELVRRALHAGLPPQAAERLEDLMRPIPDRRVLIRLQNHVLARARAQGDLARAERASLRWALLDPKDHRPWLDVASAREAQGRLNGAVEALSRAEALGAAVAGVVRDKVRRRLN
jgi:regulator of sirC expression with transglutaminase-like and TPR domain